MRRAHRTTHPARKCHSCSANGSLLYFTSPPTPPHPGLAPHPLFCPSLFPPTPHHRTPGLPLLQIFYYIIMSLFGALKGLIQLNLGNITSFQARGAGLRGAALLSFLLSCEGLEHPTWATSPPSRRGGGGSGDAIASLFVS